MPESCVRAVRESWVVDLWYPELMLGSRPELMPLIHEPVFPKVLSEVTFRHCENIAR